MKGYIKQHFGVSFYKENIEFIVNKERKIVACIMDGVLKTPFGFDTPVHINPLPVEGIGIAKCHPNDIFDEERGKRIALAKAENCIYKTASKFLESQRKYLEFFIQGIDTFLKKSTHQCQHNEDYIESVGTSEHPKHKKNLTPIKFGVKKYI